MATENPGEGTGAGAPQGPVVPRIVVETSAPRPSFVRRIGSSLLVLSIMANIYFILTLMSRGHADEWQESFAAGDRSATDKVVVLKIDGTIYGALTRRMISQIRQAREDETVKAVVVEISSPGGTISGSDAIYHYLKALADKKPVAVCMQDVCASGGYYVAVAGRRIFAHPTAWTGSIGVILTLVNVVKLSDDVGIKVDVVKSGLNKDMGSPFRPMADKDRAHFQELVDSAYDRFLDVVAENRPIDKEQLRPLADGRVLSCQDALAGKLIDEVGFVEDAVAYVKKLAKLEQAKVVRYEPRFSLGGLLTSRTTQPIELNLKLPFPPLLRTGHPQPLYLWPAVGIRAEAGTVLRGS